MNNLTLAHAWVLLLLPLPLLVWWLVPPHQMPRRGLVVPFLPRLAAMVGHDPSHGATVTQGGVLRWLTVIFCWLCIVLALARPQLIEPPMSKEIPVRDLLLAVDLSGSMETQDFTNPQGQVVDRLSAVKTVLDDFLAKRQGDRVGLILFGSAAFVQVPFTEDLDVCRQLLEEAQVRMAGPQTAFGDALGLAINVFDRSTVKERVLIALTDGNDTTSQVPPDKAAQIASDKGIVIHTVAVGDPKAVGEDALDETTLKRVASSTGGIYSHASSGKELQSIYDQLDQIETRKVQTISHRPRRDVYWWPLVACLAASMLYLSAGLLLTLRNTEKTPPENGSRSSSSHSSSSPSSASTLNSVAPAGILPFAFHFIRPEWLLALLPAALLWWLLHRQTETQRAWRGIIAPQLLDHLWGGQQKQSRFGPLEWVGLSWLILILAIAGPSWKHVPSPFADDTAALAIVVKVSPSMETEDVQPSRQERATQKIHDLLKIRGTAKASLIAYSGTAHSVMPATEDAGIINSFAQSLTPQIMPQDGDAAAKALQLADQTLEAAGGGSILWITDSIAPEQAQALNQWRRSSSTEVRLLPPLLPGDELDTLTDTARAVDAKLVSLTADDSDVQNLASAAKFADISGGSNDTRWAESGYWLTPILALMLLMFFRRGWMVSMERRAS
ncbi:VWA domain-containing protein [Pseudomaricurvus sp.]|uniref:VWA domain-containing protein n=1 Tax=Pseudomaricurvus sp. TaxID=2004510 RepID=UPI003F6D392F